MRDQFRVEPRARGGTEEGERVCMVGVRGGNVDSLGHRAGHGVDLRLVVN